MKWNAPAQETFEQPIIPECLVLYSHHLISNSAKKKKKSVAANRDAKANLILSQPIAFHICE